MIFTEIWLNRWAESNMQRPNEDIGYWLGIYGALGCLALVCTFIVHWYVKTSSWLLTI